MQLVAADDRAFPCGETNCGLAKNQNASKTGLANLKLTSVVTFSSKTCGRPRQRISHPANFRPQIIAK